MSDDQRKAKDEVGPQEAAKWGGLTEPTEADAEGHGFRWHSPEPVATVDDKPEPADGEGDTEGHRFNGY